MKKMLIAYATMSGNTLEVAELIQEVAEANDYQVTLYRIGSTGPFPVVSDYDLFLIGSYTWGKGQTPPKVKQFAIDVGYKPEYTYVFGTGDTQFGGDDLFCSAADKLAVFYNSTYHPLKIEQSPRQSQEIIVHEWIKGVMNHDVISKRNKIG